MKTSWVINLDQCSAGPNRPKRTRTRGQPEVSPYQKQELLSIWFLCRSGNLPPPGTNPPTFKRQLPGKVFRLVLLLIRTSLAPCPGPRHLPDSRVQRRHFFRSTIRLKMIRRRRDFVGRAMTIKRHVLGRLDTSIPQTCLEDPDLLWRHVECHILCGRHLKRSSTRHASPFLRLRSKIRVMTKSGISQFQGNYSSVTRLVVFWVWASF